MTEISRRTFLRSSAVGAGALALAGGWVPFQRIPAAEAALPLPPGLPSGVYPYLQSYRNWSGEVRTAQLWHVSAGSEQRVVDLANWAYANGWTIRPLGFSHSWSPFAVADGAGDVKVLMVDTRSGLSRISVSGSSVTAGVGASMDSLLGQLDSSGRGLAHCPAPGDLTVGGVLAIGGHGTGVKLTGQTLPSGHSFGSLSNSITALRAVVWDPALNKYVAKSFSRNDPTIGALLVSLGRIFLTQVTLRVGPSQYLRCRSYLGIPGSELLGAPGSSTRTLDTYLNRTGRVELIWFPFTTSPWLKTWEVASAWLPPFGARVALSPYNYVFINSIPESVSNAIADLIRDARNSEAFGKLQASLVEQGLTAELSWDLWGKASHLFRYVKPTTLRMTASGYVVLCKRADVQWVVNTFYQAHQRQIAAYRAQGRYPMNGPIEIRVNAVDNPADSGVAGAVDPWLSPTRRRPDHPEWDTAVWLGVLTLPDTPYAEQYYAEFEDRMWQLFDTDRTGIRVEWSKGWGYSPEAGAYAGSTTLAQRLPAAWTEGQTSGRFAEAAATFRTLDPHGVFESDLHRRLFA